MLFGLSNKGGLAGRDMGEFTNIYTVLVVNPEGKKPLDKP
jgi:hypothetical protein